MVAAAGAVLVCASMSASDRQRDAPNGKGQFGGIETDALQLAVPGEGCVAHQIVDRNGGVVGQAELPGRHFDRRLVGVKRIEIHRHQDHFGAIGRKFAVEQNLIVMGRIEPQAEMAVQRRMVFPDAV